MPAGGFTGVGRIDIEDWRKVARNSMLEEDRVLAMLTDMGRALPDHISGAREQATALDLWIGRTNVCEPLEAPVVP